jgi:hypothetical protein
MRYCNRAPRPHDTHLWGDLGDILNVAVEDQSPRERGIQQRSKKTGYRSPSVGGPYG